MSSRFINALRSAPRPIIMEIKRRSGDGQDLIGSRTVPEIVSAYEAAGAPCLSVVTGRWFGGSDALLREVAALTRLPLLKKDFITKQQQITQARDAGASAVLLTARILPRSLLQNLIEACLREQITPFVEIAGADELSGLRLAGCVVAVNNKDILSRERGAAVLDRSSSLLPAILASGAAYPASASGIDDPKVAAQLLDAGFRTLLIGTGLLLSGDIEAWLADVDRYRVTRQAMGGVSESRRALPKFSEAVSHSAN